MSFIVQLIPANVALEEGGWVAVGPWPSDIRTKSIFVKFVQIIGPVHCDQDIR